MATLQQLLALNSDPTPVVQTPPVQSTGYLHPILVSYLNSLPNPNLVITSHPAYPILAQTHPTLAQTNLLNANSLESFGLTPQSSSTLNPLTSGAGVATTASAPQTTSTANSGTALTNRLISINAPDSGVFSPNATLPVGALATARGTTSAIGSPPITPKAPGTPNPTVAQSPNQPLPVMGPNATPPIGNTAVVNPNTPTPSPLQPSSTPAPVTPYGSFNSATNTYSLPQGVIAGPQALMHVPYGPELTGLSGYGGLITPNGTPVAMSVWQRANLDPTSIARYNSYVSDIAGMNPADLAQIGQSETGNKMADLKAPINYSPTSQVPSPGGG